ncbi:MAG TPA: transglutaminase domain-containing protein [Clostridiaceae bacterium]|nr:transglutaminase domain-containing protein [Clostridiaceae bacterium]
MGGSVFNIDSNYLAIIEKKFQQKRELAKEREKALFGIFDGDLAEDEVLALKFLYAYMSLNDLADYDGSIFLQHVRETYHIRRLVPWGDKIPDSIFLHFVLPYRVNNENIENCRGILFEQIFDRVKNLSMKDAILEVNHWCHEKAGYIACDPRTSSPLSVIRRAIGRCGEESTLAVSALRSLCIPARQVYTPRWAHCDSNHAWVEAWADGEWYYFGACEPDLILNNGWFRDPATRAMLIHTRVPGNYPGPEEITIANEWYTELNLLKNYAPIRKITVKLIDSNGCPVPDTKVYFQVFNSGEFSNIAGLTSDKNGKVTLTTGLGDLMVHAAGEKGWGYKKISVTEEDYFEITLSKEAPVCGIFELDMIPPKETHIPLEEPSIEEKQRHEERVKEEAGIRAEYEATFLAGDLVNKVASKLSLPQERIQSVLEKARGNSCEIAEFLLEETPKYGELALKLLESLADKDLTDTFRPVLRDHLYNASIYQGKFDEEIYINYILCPRVVWEMIGCFREFFMKEFSKDEVERFQRDPELLVMWVRDNIQLTEGYTCYNGSATPRGSYELKKADRLSKAITFVAMARSFGIPARLHPADKRPQYFMSGVWKDAILGVTQSGCVSEKLSNGSGFHQIMEAGTSPMDTADNRPGRIRIVREPGCDRKVKYFTDFSIARFDESVFKSLDYEDLDWDKPEKAMEVLPGYYRLVTGTRTSFGTTLVRMTIFEVEPGKTTEVELFFRKEEGIAPVLGTASFECTFDIISAKGSSLHEESKTPAASGTSQQEETGLKAGFSGNDGAQDQCTKQAKGYLLPLNEALARNNLVVAWIEPEREPSRHLLRELRELSKEYELWGGNIILSINGDKPASAFCADVFENLPQKTLFSQDKKNACLNALLSGMDKPHKVDYPLVFVIDRGGKIRYISAGYKLGIGSEVLKTLQNI